MKKNQIISISESITFSWKKVKENLWRIWGLGLIVLIVSIVANSFLSTEGDGMIALLATIISAIIQSIIAVGVITILLDIVDGKGVIFSKIIAPVQHIARYILAYILLHLMIFAVVLVWGILLFGSFLILSTVHISEIMEMFQIDNGLSALTMPVAFMSAAVVFGVVMIAVIIYINVRFGFFPYIIVDHNSGVRESLQISSKITQHVRWKLFLFYVVIVMINIVGFLCFIVGLMLTIPLTAIAGAHVYRILSKGQTKGQKKNTKIDAKINIKKKNVSEKDRKKNNVSKNTKKKSSIKKNSDNKGKKVKTGNVAAKKS